MADKGFFLITDITGYTSFLTHSELEHAQYIIQELFASQLQAIAMEERLKVSNFQGDAILAYLPESEGVNGSVLLDNIKAIYRAFRDKIAQMGVNPPCRCNACSTIGLLDLKVFLHYGEYLLRRLGDRDELMGADVIVTHRMMKNSVKVSTGIKPYLLLSDAAFEQMLPDIDAINTLGYSEEYDHIGRVDMHVASLNEI